MKEGENIDNSESHIKKSEPSAKGKGEPSKARKITYSLGELV